MWRTLVRDGFLFSAKRALRAASQSKGECIDRALKGDRAVLALSGESKLDTAGEGGILRLGNDVAPTGGADMGSCAKGLGGIGGAVAGGDLYWWPMLTPLVFVWLLLSWQLFSHRQEQSVRSLLAVDGSDSGVVSPDSDRLHGTAGEFSDMARRKSV
jgi:hypothetical protein